MVGAHWLGKSAELRRLAEEHESAFVYDIRAGGFAYRDIFENPDELTAYLDAVMRDPSSRLHAALNGWDYPLSRESMLILDLIDVTGRANAGKKWKTRPRPWRVKGQRIGATELPREEAIERLRANAGQ